jgi:CDP-diacylglycerol--glycerol-3-phosphate 3-phosphatidyltransferase
VTFTRAIGVACNKVILLIVRGLALSRIHPNVLTFLGLVINIVAAWMLAMGQFRWGGAVVIGAGLFDMVDGRVARETNRVTRFGGFFDSVLDRYSDLGLLMGLLVWYGSINRPFYVVLTALAMAGCVMVSYTRARAENSIPMCKVGFMERPERVVLMIIGLRCWRTSRWCTGWCSPGRRPNAWKRRSSGRRGLGPGSSSGDGIY